MWDNYAIQPTEFRTARELYDFLDEANEHWRDGTWIFRGQSDVFWELHPKAMRPCPLIDEHVEQYFENRYNAHLSDPTFDELAAEAGHNTFSQQLGLEIVERNIWPIISTIENELVRDEALNIALEQNLDNIKRNIIAARLHAARERHLVLAFVRRADQTGLSVPKDSFGNLWDTPYSYGEQVLDVEARENISERHEYASIAYALAQHHNLPTRLLDWTYKPHVAAYFAAYVGETSLPKSKMRKNSNKGKRPEFIVIWAVERDSLRNTDLRTITHRRVDIGFVQAQDGVFLYDSSADEKYYIVGKWAPFELELFNLWRIDSEKILKLILPYQHRVELLDLLKSRRISKPFLMPTFDNVAQEIIDRKIDVQDILGS